MKKNKTEEKEVVVTKLTKKELILSIVLAFVVEVIVCILVILLDVYAKGLNFKDYIYTIFGDGFFVSGILGILFWLLVVVAQAGAFDMLVYGCRKFFNYIFRKHPEDTNLPSTYYDYVTLKHAKKPKRFYWSLVVCCIFLLIGVIFSVLGSIYNNY